MDLKDLQSAWEKYSAKDANKHQLGEKAIHEMLKKRTRNLIDRVDRNIRIGFGILAFIVLLFVIDDYFLSPYILNGMELEMPSWLYALDVFENTLLICTFIYFGISYYKNRREFREMKDLRGSLHRIIGLMNTYKRMSYLALFVLLIVMSVSYISGMFYGLEYAVQEQGVNMSDLSTRDLLLTVFIRLIILSLIIAGFFFFLRWGFNKLYGNYLSKLQETLNELDEAE